VQDDRVELVVTSDDGSRTYDVITTRAGRRAPANVRGARFMASRVLALVDPASEAQGKPAPLNDAP